MPPMRLRFDEAKATQAAALVLKLRGGQMHYVKLIKILYLVDREALRRWGIPVTTDHHASMDNGPIVSKILDLITEENPKPVWSRYISPPLGDYEVKLLSNDVPNDRLSRAEEKLIDDVYKEYGHKNRWEIIAYMHKLPEWRNPHGTSIPIHYRQILQALGHGEDEIKAILRELRALTVAEEILHPA